jgi:DeoR family transcriptional regulator of aga operon
MLADSSKIGKRAFATMEDHRFHKLITDSGVTAEQLAAFTDAGTEVIVAPDV